MVGNTHPSFLTRLQRLVRGSSGLSERDIRRIEERRRGLAAATQEWLDLLREMEHAGQSGDAKYETYYQAYLQAKQQQKRADLELFNLRRGLMD